MAKLFEQLFLGRLLIVMNNVNTIWDLQFEFKKSHSFTEQSHLLASIIGKRPSFELCPAVFLNMSSAFDRVWQGGVLQELSRVIIAR